jgi:hypothetical protein
MAYFEEEVFALVSFRMRIRTPCSEKDLVRKVDSRYELLLVLHSSLFRKDTGLFT